MRKNRQRYDTAFLIVSALAALFVLTELVLKSFGKSICAYEGCKMTAQYARFGDLSIFAIGLATFLSLAIFSSMNRSGQKPSIDRFINVILVIALACEGFFMGYLAFRIHTICVFCVIIFGFMVTLGALRVLAGEMDVLAGFAALAAVFFMQYLVLPAGIPVDLHTNERLILFYSKDCKHCAEVIKELEDRKISVLHLPVNEYDAFLKNMGIEYVPTLYVNDPYQKLFLTGKDAIIRYLGACEVAKKPVVKTVRKAPPRTPHAAPAGGTGTTIDIFNQPGFVTLPTSSVIDDGMCKQDEICK